MLWMQMRILKNFKEIAGSDCDNIVTIVNDNPSALVSPFKLTVGDLTLQDCADLYLTLSIKANNSSYVEAVRVSFNDVINRDMPNIPTIAATYLFNLLLMNTQLSNVTISGQEVSLSSVTDFKVEVFALDAAVLDKITGSIRSTQVKTTVEDIEYYKKTFNVTQTSPSYITNALTLSSNDLLSPIVLKKTNLNDESNISFNLRDVFDNIVYDKSIKLQASLSTLEGDSQISEVIPLSDIYVIPSNSYLYNINYDQFKDNFLTVSKPNRRIRKEKTYCISYISLDGEQVAEFTVLNENKKPVLNDVIVNVENRGIIYDLYFSVEDTLDAKYLNIKLSNGASIEFKLYSKCDKVIFNEIYFQNSLGGIEMIDMWKKYKIQESLGEQQTYAGEYKGERKVATKGQSVYIALTSDLITNDETDVYIELGKSKRIWYFKDGEKRDVIVTKFDQTKDSTANSNVFEIQLDDKEVIR